MLCHSPRNEPRTVFRICNQLLSAEFQIHVLHDFQIEIPGEVTSLIPGRRRSSLTWVCRLLAAMTNHETELQVVASASQYADAIRDGQRLACRSSIPSLVPQFGNRALDMCFAAEHPVALKRHGSTLSGHHESTHVPLRSGWSLEEQ